jgi:hypothetical protein
LLSLLVYPDPLKISSLTEKANPSSRGSAGGAAAAETTTESSSSSSKQPRRRNRRRQRRNKNSQKKTVGMSTISAQVSDINVADIEKDNKNGNIMAESEFKKEEAPAITETAEEVVTTNTEATVNSDETTRAREWFATLSTEDQVVALGFVDPDFLETLVSRKSITSISAAPSSRPSACGGNPTMDGHPSKGQYSY